MIVVQYFHLNKKELVDIIVDKIKYCKKNILIRVIRVDKDYPNFTAEKQIELIKWYLNNYRGEIFDTIETTEWFEEQLCAYINNEWENLTLEERKQIKDILE